MSQGNVPYPACLNKKLKSPAKHRWRELKLMSFQRGLTRKTWIYRLSSGTEIPDNRCWWDWRGRTQVAFLINLHNFRLELHSKSLQTIGTPINQPKFRKQLLLSPEFMVSMENAGWSTCVFLLTYDDLEPLRQLQEHARLVWRQVQRNVLNPFPGF